MNNVKKWSHGFSNINKNETSMSTSRAFWLKEDWNLKEIRQQLRVLEKNKGPNRTEREIYLSRAVLIRGLSRCKSSETRDFIISLQKDRAYKNPTLQRYLLESLLIQSSAKQRQSILKKELKITKFDLRAYNKLQQDIYSQYLLVTFGELSRLQPIFISHLDSFLQESDSWETKIDIYRLAEWTNDIPVWSKIAVVINNPHQRKKTQRLDVERTYSHPYYNHTSNYSYNVIKIDYDKLTYDVKWRRRTLRKLTTTLRKDPILGIQFLDSYLKEFSSLSSSNKDKDNIINNCISTRSPNPFPVYDISAYYSNRNHKNILFRPRKMPPNILRYVLNIPMYKFHSLREIHSGCDAI